MRKHLAHLSVALLTFVVGVSAATLLLVRPWHSANDGTAGETGNAAAAAEPLPIFFGPTHCTFRIPETPEEKAVRLAEEFVARNGYTDLPPDRGHVSYESVERETNLDETLKLRHDTLEGEAYGIRYGGKLDGPGRTIAFRYNSMRLGCLFNNIGRAVTMDKDFQNLRVEHKDFPLANVHKKF